MPTSHFSFVACEPSRRRPDPATSLLVRSHCMKGRNSRVGSRRALQQAKRAALEASQFVLDGSILPTGQDELVVDLCQLRSASCRALAPQFLPLLVQLDPATAQLARSVRKSPNELLQELTKFARISESSHWAEPFVDFNSESHLDAPPLDDGLLHSMLLINSIALDLSQQRPIEQSTCSNLVQTLRIVNQKLSGQDTWVQDSVFYSILYLALAAAALGDKAAFQSHMTGLKKIVELRGGYERSPKVQFKLERLDLLWALKFGGNPCFLPKDEANFAAPAASQNDKEIQPWFLGRLDSRLQFAFEQLQQVVVLANQQHNHHTKLSMRAFQNVLSPVQALLLRFERLASDLLDEWMCLGMLVFIAGMFRVPHSEPTWTYLGGRLRVATSRMRLCRDIASSEVTAWVLMLSAITVVDPKESWLRGAWADCVDSQTNWYKVHQQLQQVLWINSIHDRLATAAFHILKSSREGA